jgi:hypothetical protein
MTPERADARLHSEARRAAGAILGLKQTAAMAGDIRLFRPLLFGVKGG